MDEIAISAEGAKLWRCAAPSALIVVSSAYPGLTAGPILCRRFAPLNCEDDSPEAVLESGSKLPHFEGRRARLMLQNFRSRSLEEAAKNRPGRQAGIGVMFRVSTEGAAHKVSHLRRSSSYRLPIPAFYEAS